MKRSTDTERTTPKRRRSRSLAFLLGLSSFLLSPQARAESTSTTETKPVVTFGGFIDTYYQFDFNQPTPNERVIGTPEGIPNTIPQLATTATRHNEFNVNLAYIEANLAANDLRGRLALQAGTSVQATYATEPTNGLVSGPNLIQHIQEATLGYQIASRLWVDAGIFLSHIGFESFISKDNWTYTRSLMADFSPYYEAGVKLSWEATPRLNLQLLVLNGWQNVFDNNGNKAVGLKTSYTFSDRFSVAYNNFFGEEVGTLWRFLNDFIVTFTPWTRLQLALNFDLGFQRKPSSSDASSWYGVALFARYQLAQKLFLTARVERYSDPDRVIAQPVGTLSLNANGASLNIDYELRKGLLWRNEVRGLWADSPIFVTDNGFSSNDTFAVTSLSFAF